MHYTFRSSSGQMTQVGDLSWAGVCRFAPKGWTLTASDDPNAPIGSMCPGSQPAPLPATVAVNTLTPPPANAGLTLGGVLGTIGTIATGVSTGGVKGGLDAVIGALTGGGATSTMPVMSGAGPTCPQGYTMIGGTCFANNAGAYLPGGQPATTTPSGTVVTTSQPVTTGTAVVPSATSKGGAVIPAGTSVVYTPTQKQIIERRCPKIPGLGRLVLAVDGNCYPKRLLPKAWRLHKPRPRPPITAAQAKAIRTAHAAENRVERLAKKVGLHVTKEPRRRSSSRKR